MQYQIIPVTALHQNCSLLWCQQSGSAALIDPGGEPQRLIDAVAAQSVTLTQILLTHGHLDHVGAAAELAAYFQVPIVGPHRADHFLLESLPLQSQRFGFSLIEPFTPSRWLTENEIISIGQQQLSVRHCPGHTPGHIIFFCQTARLAWVGDVLFHGSIGRTDFPRSDRAALLNSIQQQLYPLGDDVTFIPGHGPISTLGHERRYNPYTHSCDSLTRGA